MMKRPVVIRSLVYSAWLFFFACRNGIHPYPQACTIRDGSGSIEVLLERRNDSDYYIEAFRTVDAKKQRISRWRLHFPVCHFECADINGDGVDDILVGVIKATRFDSALRKRIFIFKLADGVINPLWLGSRVSQPLADFKVVRPGEINVIRTIEYEQNGKYLVAEYKWRGFGLEFIRYLARNKGLYEARELLNCINC